eukprot:scpid98086/ scgid20203/ 
MLKVGSSVRDPAVRMLVRQSQSLARVSQTVAVLSPDPTSSLYVQPSALPAWVHVFCGGIWCSGGRSHHVVSACMLSPLTTSRGTTGTYPTETNTITQLTPRSALSEIFRE